ncbi:MAG TPA: VPLPA-CTERM sorting domain-containing protein [Steroidobacteraceae bacterium]|nr:VPLPA-CTERM sorting domain-containing protein [Steroidobacteraceae bacterium]
MNISRAALAVAAVLSFAAVAAPASATIVTYDWTTSGVGTSGELAAGSGTITVDTSQTKVVSGFTGDLITGITGSIGNDTITGLVAANGGNFGNNDDLLFVTGTPTVLDTNGFSFKGSIGGVAQTTDFTLLSSCSLGSTTTCTGPNPIQLDGPGGTFLNLGQGSFTITPVPLPASAWMLLFGIGALGLAAVRQSKQA